MNNKGFMMAEVVVVSSIILLVLTGLYTSYNRIISIYKQRISYYDVDALYELAYVRSGIDFNEITPSIDKTVYTGNGEKIYYVNKYKIGNLKVTNQTFKDYIKFLNGSLDFENMEVKDKKVTNILIMEKCETDGKTNCKYAYLEVPDETE